MRYFVSTFLIAGFLTLSGSAFAEQGKGLNVLVTSADRQAQMMAMVLSVNALAKHGKEVNVVFCGQAGDLALKSTQTEPMLPAKKSPSMLLNKLIQSGATVQVCPLYLPNAGKTTNDLIDGVVVAKPPVLAGKLLDKDYQNLSF
jgi:predicted peroxiredoxin